MKINFFNLALEITRRCNMSCPHCLRGDAQDADMDFSVIRKVLSETASISDLTFTGGEPSLRVEAMRYALDFCKENGIEVYGFFVATNGKEITDDFLLAMLEWDAYCLRCNGGDTESFSAVALSEDVFHEKIPEENRYRLMTLRTFSDVKKTDWNDAVLINAGRAKGLSGYRTREPNVPSRLGIEVGESIINIDDTVLVSANGNIITYCDYAYEQEDDLSIGNVDEGVAHVLLRLIENEEESD